MGATGREHNAKRHTNVIHTDAAGEIHQTLLNNPMHVLTIVHGQEHSFSGLNWAEGYIARFKHDFNS